MPAPGIITVSQLSRLVGTPDAPRIVDVRTEEDFASDPRTLPGSVRRDVHSVADWADGFGPGPVAVVCQRGQKLSQGAAAWLRHLGTPAETLEGGFDVWAASGGACWSAPTTFRPGTPAAVRCG